MHVLVTGGAGYIGSHTVVELLADGHEVLIVDDLSNSQLTVLDNIEQIASKRPAFIQADITDTVALGKLLAESNIDAIIHFAAFKAVGESVTLPLKYYRNNVGGIVELLQVALDNHVNYFVFSSSAAVYGEPPTAVVTEETECRPTSPYGWSKRMDEIILEDTCTANPHLHGIGLRYFNVVGAHDSGLLGETPKTQPSNLLPIIVRAVTGQLPPVTVFGTDYPTKDGTCERDYIHVVDLAKAHVAALGKISTTKTGKYHVYNVGTGHPTSVKEMIATFESVNGIRVPHTMGPRRAGDPVAYYASAAKAEQELNWRAEKTLEDAVRDAWRWQQTLDKR